MAQFISLSHKQGRVLLKFLGEALPPSIDEAVEKFGMDSAFVLYALKNRLERNFPDTITLDEDTEE